MKLDTSELLYRKAIELIPGGSQMYNKRPVVYEPARYPIFAERSQGAYLYDVDGNTYIDYLLAYGAIHLGYNYAPVMNAVIDQIRIGTIHSVNDTLEITLAEELVETIPCAEMARFFLSGSEATSAAVRIAKAHTGRSKIVKWGYHGWHEWTRMVKGGPSAGMADYLDMIHCPVESIGSVSDEVSRNTIELRYNSIESLADILKADGNDIACIIMEPFYFELPEKRFLEEVKTLAFDCGCVLVFDEVKTGMRVSPGGAQQFLDVVPDLAVFSKAMANGYPFSAVVGKKEVMKACERLWFAGTNCGNAVGMSAALATIRESKRVQAHEHIWKLGTRIMDGMRALIERYEIEGKVGGLPAMPFFVMHHQSREEKKRQTGIYLAEMIERGVFMPVEHCFYISYAHSAEDIDKTLNAVEESFRAVARSRR